jgi:hypothetical protein
MLEVHDGPLTRVTLSVRLRRRLPAQTRLCLGPLLAVRLRRDTALVMCPLGPVCRMRLRLMASVCDSRVASDLLH